MNKHLVDFINDELKTNDYYAAIRRFAVGKGWNHDILSPVVNEYDRHLDAFGPYKFLDAIEDYVDRFIWGADDENPLLTASSLQEVIDRMWEEDAFENY